MKAAVGSPVLSDGTGACSGLHSHTHTFEQARRRLDAVDASRVQRIIIFTTRERRLSRTLAGESRARALVVEERINY